MAKSHLSKENLENCKADDVISKVLTNLSTPQSTNTVELGDKELSDKEQIGVKEPFSVTDLLHKDKEHLALRNNFRETKKFLITKFDCIKEREIGSS